MVLNDLVGLEELNGKTVKVKRIYRTLKDDKGKERAKATATAINSSLALVTGHKAARTSQTWTAWIKQEAKNKS